MITQAKRKKANKFLSRVTDLLRADRIEKALKLISKEIERHDTLRHLQVEIIVQFAREARLTESFNLGLILWEQNDYQRSILVKSIYELALAVYEVILDNDQYELGFDQSLHNPYSLLSSSRKFIEKYSAIIKTL